MLRTFYLLPLLMLACLLLGCEKTDVGTDATDGKQKPQQAPAQAAEPEPTAALETVADLQTASTTTFKTIEWTDLIPKADLDILLNPPSYVTDVEDGSSDDEIGSEIRMTVIPPKDDPYQQALVSKKIIPEMDGKSIRIPGFVVPLAFGDNQSITQFFLVPYFGACIHLPPPPPNQIIFVEYPKGFQVEDMYHPFWISGTLKTSLIENELATAAYTMKMQSFEIYSE